MNPQDESDLQPLILSLSKEKILALLSLRLDCAADSLSFIFSSTDASEPSGDSMIIPDLRFH